MVPNVFHEIIIITIIHQGTVNSAANTAIVTAAIIVIVGVVRGFLVLLR